MTMTPDQAISYIENYTWSSSRLGLDRTFELMERLGSPEKKLKFIHVAGSNGKGSTCAMLSSILISAGYRVGTYTSPHLVSFYERFLIDGEEITPARLAEITEKVSKAADAMSDHPSQFEISTAIAMEYFYEEGCDIVVLEVGLGGRLDSTNIIPAPLVSVITNIGLEHTEYLGNTLTEVAYAKGGIIKRGARCVCYNIEAEALSEIKRICEEEAVPLTVTDFDDVISTGKSIDGQKFTYKGKEYSLSLLGAHQLKNVGTVLETIEQLKGLGYEISEDAISRGLYSVKWPGRFQVLSKDPLFILDGGHNPQCARALRESIEEYLPDRKIVFLLGILADKDYDEVLNIILPLASEVICVTPDSERALDAERLCEIIKKKLEVCPSLTLSEDSIYACESVFDGIKKAANAAAKLTEESCDSAVVAFGSLYMAGSVITEHLRFQKSRARKAGILAREAISPEDRNAFSAEIIRRIRSLNVYKNANTVMIYRSIKSEVSLDGLLSAGGRLCFPLCERGREMKALRPPIQPGETGITQEKYWKKGAFGIPEPNPETCKVVSPSEIDLVICPLTAFDERLNRVGMGAGYYDRFLPKCKNAVIIGVSFDAQKADSVPTDKNDFPMEMIITEKGVYNV